MADQGVGLRRWIYPTLIAAGVVMSVPVVAWLAMGHSLPTGDLKSFLLEAAVTCGLCLFLGYPVAALAYSLRSGRRALYLAGFFAVGAVFVVVEVMPPWPT